MLLYTFDCKRFLCFKYVIQSLYMYICCYKEMERIEMRTTSFSSYSRLFRMNRRDSCCCFFFVKKEKEHQMHWTCVIFDEIHSILSEKHFHCTLNSYRKVSNVLNMGVHCLLGNDKAKRHIIAIDYHFEHKCLFYAVRQSIYIIDNNTWFHLFVRMCRLFWALQRICHIQYLQPCQWNRYN